MMQKIELPLSRSVALRGRVIQETEIDLDAMIDTQISIGVEVKNLRKASGITLKQLSEASGLSQGYLSQIERDLSSPSIKAVHSISRALGVNISWFFRVQPSDGHELADYVVRRNNRRSLKFESGITDELLSPNLGRGIELLRCTFSPHSCSGNETYEHNGEEAGIILSGGLTLWLDGKRIELRTGDSFAFESSLPHRYANEYDEPTVIIWAITPPSY